MSKPKYIEEYEVNFGSHVQFDLGMNFIMLDKAWLNKSIPENNKKGSSKAAWAIAKKQCDLEQKNMKPGFIDQILSIHRNKLPNIVGLSEMADILEMSPATLKRKLAKHNFSFQRSQDLMRLSVSLKMMQQQGLKVSELADFLEITDVNNFRRAFKRWCGMTPAALKERLV
jgi:AraC-like DNA-binding protein